MSYTATFRNHRWNFADLRVLMAKASPRRSADELAGLAASSEVERALAQHVLADVPLRQFIEEPLIPPEQDEVSHLILERHDAVAFQPIRAMTVGEFRDWLLADNSDLAHLAQGLTPEMAAAVCKLMRNQDLIAVARRCRVISRFRNTLGLEGRLSTRLQPNHPKDDVRGIAAALSEQRLTLSPICLVPNGRVALADEIGALLGAPGRHHRRRKTRTERGRQPGPLFHPRPTTRQMRC